MKPLSVVMLVFVVGTVAVTGCGDESSTATTTVETTSVIASTTSTASAPAQQQGMGPNSGLSERHRSPIPAEYAGLTNPIAADEESLARGADAYVTCAVCHGDGGLGDGAAGVSLDPAPANVAHTSQMMGDDYLFWRITEGGVPFNTLMPAWGTALDEQTRWDLINYMRALGTGSVTPRRGTGGGAAFDPEANAVQQAALLAVAVDQGVITQAESDLFAEAHDLVDARMADVRGTTSGEGVDSMLTDVLAGLVDSGDLTQNQADTFLSVHDRLSQAGLLQ